MPAEKANTTSLVTVRLRPTVLHAAGESFMPTRRRPNDPRRKAPTPMQHKASTTASSTSKARSVVKCMPKMSGRPTGTEPPTPMTEVDWKKMLSMSTAKAKVARAR